MTNDLNLKPIPDYGDLIELSEFADMVESGYLIDYDGFGQYSDGKSMSNNCVQPSTFDKNSAFSHVVWFNR